MSLSQGILVHLYQGWPRKFQSQQNIIKYSLFDRTQWKKQISVWIISIGQVLSELWAFKGSKKDKILEQKIMTKSKNSEKDKRNRNTILNILYLSINCYFFAWNIYKVKVMNTVCMNKSL